MYTVHTDTHTHTFPGKSHDRGAWRAVVHGAIKSQTRLSAQAPHLAPLSREDVCSVSIRSELLALKGSSSVAVTTFLMGISSLCLTEISCKGPLASFQPLC